MTDVFDFDVDIDCANRDKLLELFSTTPASIKKQDELVKHNTGVYFQDIPISPLNGISCIEHKQAAREGWFKVDFLNNYVYENITDPAQLDELMSAEPIWNLLEFEEVVTKLYHINDHYSLVKSYKPNSTEQLAMLLAIIRPAKKHLQGLSWSKIAETVWDKPNDGAYYFKKSHAIAFAKAIEVQLNQLTQELSNQLS